MADDPPTINDEDDDNGDAVLESNSDDDGFALSDGEGDDENFRPTEPSYKIANSTPFSIIAGRLEELYQLKVQKRKIPVPREEKLKRLLPPNFLKVLNKDRPGKPPESIYPIMRLLVPDLDGSRRVGMKEAFIAKAYKHVFGWPDDNPDYQALTNYSDPKKVGNLQGVGDFSEVLKGVLKKRLKERSKEKKSITVGQLNDLLDELASTWKQNQVHPQDAKASPKKKTTTITTIRGEWFKKLRRLEVNALEQKWIVRIILQNMQITLQWVTILQWYHPLGPHFWSAHNSLKAICNKLCQPGVKSARRLEQSEQVPSLAPYFQTGHRAHVKFGLPFTPMVSERTGFGTVLKHMSAASKSLAKDGEDEQDPLESLAVKFPAFTIETKLDGERMLVHFARSGVVKIHSRRAKWFSELYTPILGPALRRALLHNGMDLILDGEILSWDDGRKETLPFGTNRTVANLRHEYLKYKGMLEDIDANLHDGETEHKSMNSSNLRIGDDSQVEVVGEDCWLQFVAFDVVYINGPSAADFLKMNTSTVCHSKLQPGSLVDLEGLERKKLLYKLVKPQPKEVEIVPTVVVRPTGETATGEEYFNVDNPVKENGVASFELDSHAVAFGGTVDILSNIDKQRRNGRTDEQISKSRARALEQRYQQVVEEMKLEGLMYKNLSAPYLMDQFARSLGYWRKFKPDYFNGSFASDIDLVVIGAYFASGLRLAGKPSSLLCACVDSFDKDCFLPLCKVNAGSMGDDVLRNFFRLTGFKAATSNEGMQLGNWFEPEERSWMPDFISLRSKQIGYEGRGWRAKKEDYPDLWIHPRDSYSVTVNAGEIVNSDAFSPGITLRFPRVTKLRTDADAKAPEDIESEVQLWDIYKRVLEDRSRNTEYTDMSANGGQLAGPCRFLTEAENAAKERKNRRSKRKVLELAVETVETPNETLSSSFKGIKFQVLDGTYDLERDEIAVEEATEDGWLKDGKAVQSSLDVQTFIKKHQGTVVLEGKPGEKTWVVGGVETDSRVTKRVERIESAIRANAKRKPSQKTKAAIRNEQLSKEPGVLRWTYLFPASKEGLQPCPIDYLARPEQQSRDFGVLANKHAMRRALSLTGKRKRESNLTWKEHAREILPSQAISMFLGPLESVVLYAHIFQDASSVDNHWDSRLPVRDDLAALLPLVRLLGGQTVMYLRENVTHVLCRANDDLALDSSIERVSSEWIHSQWDLHHST